MARVERFEDLHAWQKARELARVVYDYSRGPQFSKDFGLSDQIRRAAVSIMSNIAEGFERGGDREFVQFLSAAKGSSGELRAQLYVAADQGYVSEEQCLAICAAAVEVSRMISGVMKYLKQSDLRGSKYK